jgi:hypothetical protein
MKDHTVLVPFPSFPQLLMPTRLLSFLSDIEEALLADPIAKGRGAWEISRMVNYDNHLARMTLTPRRAEASAGPTGSIFLQAYELTNDTACLKASLHWNGQERYSMLTVHAKGASDWREEATRIAKAWFAGPPAASVERSAAPARLPMAVAS